jgi:hypothetical protein
MFAGMHYWLLVQGQQLQSNLACKLMMPVKYPKHDKFTKEEKSRN